MWFNAPPKQDKPLPVWQRGYRIHGYWLDGTRMGYVGLSPRVCSPIVYTWGLDATEDRGECTTLRAAKRQVEHMFRKRYSWRFPASRGY